MIAQQEYQKRRKALMHSLDKESVVVIRGAGLSTRSHDTTYKFRQQSDFYYLTGFNEPNAALILTPSEPDVYHLFVMPKVYEEELWDGPRVGLEGATAHFLADKSYDIGAFDKTLLSLMENKAVLYYAFAEDEYLDTFIPKSLKVLKNQKRKGIESPKIIKDISDPLSEMRLIKSDAEQAVIRTVCERSAAAHINAMKKAKQVSNEFELHASLLHDFIASGCQGEAYDSIVGAGANACVLHYIKNNAEIEQDDLILIDAGAELGLYAADITRTFPKNGRFSSSQRAIYDLVLKAQLAAIELVKPGLCWTALQETIVSILTEGLCELGIIKEEKAIALEQALYKPFYMHNSGHWLGIDVHDLGSYKQNGEWRTLQPGMVLTIEPGIYIASHHSSVDPKWHNIGVRIEDDILVTDSGYEVLTHQVPKAIDEIEALMSDAE